MTFTAPVPALFERLSAGLPELEVAASARPVREIAAKTPDALRALLRLAVERRAPLAADHETTIYRLVNGAADGLPGMTADRYGDALILSLYDDDGSSPPTSQSPNRLVTGLAEIAGGRSVYVKYRPPSASRLSDGDMAALAPRQPILGPDMSEFLAQEEGLNYLIRPGEGFSVGLFPDMRETRARVRAWAAGKRVLNCFAYTCGFGVAATAGGATRVLNLDLSKSALEWGKANYRANGFAPDDHDFVYGDVFDWLARLAKRDERFDLVILDPPGFSRTKSRLLLGRPRLLAIWPGWRRASSRRTGCCWPAATWPSCRGARSASGCWQVSRPATAPPRWWACITSRRSISPRRCVASRTSKSWPRAWTPRRRGDGHLAPTTTGLTDRRPAAYHQAAA